MSGSWFTENFSDFSDEFFDELGDIKYYECPLDDIEPSDDVEDWEVKFLNLEPPPINELASISSGSFLENDITDLKLNKGSEISAIEPLQPKPWQGDDQCGRFKPSSNSSDDKSRTCSPVSVLDSSSTSSSCVVENLSHCFPKATTIAKRPRSKRFTRRRTFAPVLAHSNRFWNGMEFDSGFMDDDLPLPVSRETQLPSNALNFPSEGETAPLEATETRRCSHCHVTNTPQWREGPLGPKTLCNACGVRYRSGRLYPEYRPAASPTFVPSIHSNSHRKVLEMRKKSGVQIGSSSQQPSMPSRNSS